MLMNMLASCGDSGTCETDVAPELSIFRSISILGFSIAVRVLVVERFGGGVRCRYDLSNAFA